MFERINRFAERAPNKLVFGIPTGFLVLTIIVGSVGTYWHLSSQPAYAGHSTWELTVESFLTGVGFLVIDPGPFPSEASTALWVVFLGRILGVLFVISTVLTAVAFVFTQVLQRIDIRATHRWASIFSDASKAQHSLICGLTDESAELTRQLRADDERVVLLEDSSTPAAVRNLRRSGAWILHGQLDDPDDLVSHGKLDIADEVFVAAEDEGEAISIVQALYEIAEERKDSDGEPIRCYVNLSPSGTRKHLHEQVGTSSGFRTRIGRHDVLELHTYDEPTATARELLMQHPPDLAVDAGGDSVHVLLIGWSPTVRAVVTQLCYLLHVEQSCTRRVTIATEDPEEHRRELFSDYPCLERSSFSEDNHRQFTDSLFPDIEFVHLPARPEHLMSDTSPVVSRFEDGQQLTVIFGEEEGLQTGYRVSGIVPRLDDYVSSLDMHAKVLYYEAADSELPIEQGIDVESIEQTVLESFTAFYDGVTPAAVRGTRRDRLAKQVALYYFLEYDYGNAETPAYLNERTSEIIGHADISEFKTASLWEELTEKKLTELANLHWNALSEHYRNANRFAADHALFKQRIASRYRDRSAEHDDGPRSDDEGLDPELVEMIAEIEHRRWCAEKLLNGWEPLPKDQWADWEEETMQQKLRSQRYHRDLWPLSELEMQAPEAFQKDVEQVQFVLNMLQLKENDT